MAWPYPDLDQNLWPHAQVVILLVEMCEIISVKYRFGLGYPHHS
jgi:hypothetical protein